MKDHSAEQRLRHYGPCYLAGAPASAGALPSKDRKNVQSAGLIHRISTRLALCCGLTQAVIAPGNHIACSSSKITCMQANEVGAVQMPAHAGSFVGPFSK